MADDAATEEPEPELPFHERPQDLRQKGNDYEAYLKNKAKGGKKKPARKKKAS